jgi:hypothetical protein
MASMRKIALTIYNMKTFKAFWWLQLLIYLACTGYSEEIATLLKPTKFDILIGGLKAGEITTAAGTTVIILKKENDKVLVSLNASSNWVNKLDLLMTNNTLKSVPQPNDTNGPLPSTKNPDSTQENQPSTRNEDWPFSLGNKDPLPRDWPLRMGNKETKDIFKERPNNAEELMKKFLPQYSNSAPKLSFEYSSTKIELEGWGKNKEEKIQTLRFSSEKIPIDKYDQTKKARDVLIDLCISKFGAPSRHSDFPTEFIKSINTNKVISQSDLVKISNDNPMTWNANGISIRLNTVIFNGILPYHTNRELLCYVGLEATDSNLVDKPNFGATNVQQNSFSSIPVVLYPSNNITKLNSEEILITKEVSVPTGIGGTMFRLEKLSPEWENYLKKRKPSAREMLEAHGITLPKGASATYLSARNMFLIRNTQENINKTEQLINDAARGLPIPNAPIPDATPTPTIEPIPDLLRESLPPDSPLIQKEWIVPLEFSRGFLNNNAQDYLKNWGVTFPIGCSATFIVSKNLLCVTNTEGNIKLIQTLINESVRPSGCY